MEQKSKNKNSVGESNPVTEVAIQSGGVCVQSKTQAQAAATLEKTY
jgi:hypothetical protein